MEYWRKCQELCTERTIKLGKTYPMHPLHLQRSSKRDNRFYYELLCDRHIKGPLAILKGEWEEPIENGHSVLSYILDTRSKLNSMTDWATINDTKVTVYTCMNSWKEAFNHNSSMWIFSLFLSLHSRIVYRRIIYFLDNTAER